VSRDALALVVGTVLAIVGLGFVLYPLFVEGSPAPRQARRPRAGDSDRERAVDALREIEFDRETGKLSDSDYAALKAEYTQEAIAAMRAEESATALAGASDPAEAAVLRYRQRARECAACGPRPEPDAADCSNCGVYLAGARGHCGAAVTEPGAAYCIGCGQALAA
jgi:cytochrome c-type biogenesis protein CcmI